MKKTVLTFGIISGVVISVLMTINTVFADRIGFDILHALGPARDSLAASGIVMAYTDILNVGKEAEQRVRQQQGGTHADEIETSIGAQNRALAQRLRVADRGLREGILTELMAKGGGGYSAFVEPGNTITWNPRHRDKFPSGAPTSEGTPPGTSSSAGSTRARMTSSKTCCPRAFSTASSAAQPKGWLRLAALPKRSEK